MATSEAAGIATEQQVGELARLGVVSQLDVRQRGQVAAVGDPVLELKQLLHQHRTLSINVQEEQQYLEALPFRVPVDFLLCLMQRSQDMVTFLLFFGVRFSPMRPILTNPTLLTVERVC